MSSKYLFLFSFTLLELVSSATFVNISNIYSSTIIFFFSQVITDWNAQF